ncbi:hypothetical protein [Lepagella muris]|jgi:hypothetical protein|uniref:hypothetical protein n=1 Tax=Lepagella muris TaxID=3032870 RepID=UPI0014428AD1|nr:hypothetical protein [Lepagella muris]
MIQVADNVVAELVRHIPMILELLPRNPTKSLRVANAIRMTKININKLKELDDERKRNRNQQREL